MPGDLVNLLADLKEDEVMKLVKERLDAGEDAMDIPARKVHSMMPSAPLKQYTVESRPGTRTSASPSPSASPIAGLAEMFWPVS